MRSFKSSNKQVTKLISGRNYLIADSYNWINGRDQEISMTSMDAQYQISCAKWLVTCLGEIEGVGEEAQMELLPLIRSKMNEFEEIFPLALKREDERSRLSRQQDFDETVEKFKNLIDSF
ncbi:hypothetical protein ACQCVK_04165 [Rossellomorea vietnamensis]|uniref:hypothetical protein n=1 Tax=Rossellomorea vietnamensis TaxID=218284 RepID=UPI003CF9B138